MARYGIKVGIDNVLITSGAQQALDLIGRLLINPGDEVLTEEPTFLGALQAFTACQARFLPVPIDDEGLRVDLVEKALRAGPKFLYVLPNFQNPGGVTLSLERRERLVELASHYGVPIVEDDPYGQLRYEGTHLPPLVKVDAVFHGFDNGERAFRGDVLYLGTLSKILGPGPAHRLGGGARGGHPQAGPAQAGRRPPHEHVHADGGLRDGPRRLPGPARADDPDALRRAARRDARRPRRATPRTKCAGRALTGGLFLWVTLPEGIDSADVLEDALHEEVAFVPGASFYPRGGGENTLRLNFSYCDPATDRGGNPPPRGRAAPARRLAIGCRTPLNTRRSLRSGPWLRSCRMAAAGCAPGRRARWA